MATRIFTDAFAEQVYQEDLTAHEPDLGTSWSQVGNATPYWRTEGGVAVANRVSTSDFSGRVATAASAPNDQSVACDINLRFTAAATIPGVLFRWTDASNYLWLRQNIYETNNLQVVESVAGVETLLSDDPYTFTTNTAYRFKAVVVGTAITCFIDGVQITNLNATATLTGGKTGIGMIQTSGSDTWFNDFAWDDESAASNSGAMTLAIPALAGAGKATQSGSGSLAVPIPTLSGPPGVALCRPYFVTG